MENPSITFIINGNTYSLRATDSDAISKINNTDRQHLIGLLGAVERQEQASKQTVQRTADSLKVLTETSSNAIESSTHSRKAVKESVETERLSGPQVDDLMARLVMEEAQHKKPGLTKSGVYKFVGILAIVIIALILIL